MENHLSIWSNNLLTCQICSNHRCVSETIISQPSHVCVYNDVLPTFKLDANEEEDQLIFNACIQTTTTTDEIQLDLHFSMKYLKIPSSCLCPLQLAAVISYSSQLLLNYISIKSQQIMLGKIQLFFFHTLKYNFVVDCFLFFEVVVVFLICRYSEIAPYFQFYNTKAHHHTLLLVFHHLSSSIPPSLWVVLRFTSSHSV